MNIQIFDGKAFAKKILARESKPESAPGARPVLCDILVGRDPVSISYVKIKQRAAVEAGLDFRIETLPEHSTVQELLSVIDTLNRIESMAGLILQLPLPVHLESQRQTFLDEIRPNLDVDCLGTYQKTQFYEEGESYLPPAAAAVWEIILSLNLPLQQIKTVIVGQGELVGRPVGDFFRRHKFPFEVAGKDTPSISALTREADLVVLAAGHPALLKGDMIKKGAFVIDAGTSESSGGIVGDADFDSVSIKAGFLTPVPGGVGPVTVAMLIKNSLESASRLEKK
jgi:methylenetetrahydrofolate dehydrogenase (NADP+)/methenyltetrahydrofolate cyclohydrolase